MTTDDGQIYHPEMVEDDATIRPEGVDKMDCFLDFSRVCNASCMAYLTFPRGEPKELSKQQAHCALLLFSERASRHLAILASTMVSAESRNKIADQDRRREKSVEPTGPFASPFPAAPKAKP